MFNNCNYFKLFTPVKNENKRKLNYQILYAIKLAKPLCKVWHVLYAIHIYAVNHYNYSTTDAFGIPTQTLYHIK